MSTRPGRRVLMVAGEASGDLLGARLAAALLRADPTLRLYGVGGPAMRAAGVDLVVDAAELSVMGFSDVLGRLVPILGIFRRLRRELGEARPDLFVPIDFPDFNLPLARVARRAGIAVFWYVSPQVWAWRRGRIAKLARRVSRMLVLFPFEAEMYRGRGVDAHFVGHPLAEDLVPGIGAATAHGMGAAASRSMDADAVRGAGAAGLRASLGLGPGCRLLALLPGSRPGEVERMLPCFLDAAAKLPEGTDVVVAEAPSLPVGLVADLVARHHAAEVTMPGLPRVGRDATASAAPAAGAAGATGAAAAATPRVQVVKGRTADLLAAADAALVTSGTATLEAALLGCPMVVAYRMSRLTHMLARLLVRVPFIAMPNLLLLRALVPELVQDAATPEALAAEAVRLLEDDACAAAQREGFASIRRMLVQPGAADRAAALVLDLLA